MNVYTVNLWASYPDLGNDDCMTGKDFETEAEARECIANLGKHFDMVFYRDCPFIELDGPWINEVIEIPGVKKRAKIEDAMDRNERGIQAGMMGGCDAYNEAMGYD